MYCCARVMMMVIQGAAHGNSRAASLVTAFSTTVFVGLSTFVGTFVGAHLAERKHGKMRRR
jgi:hypothetical protein